MERESFEDADVAAVMNERIVCVKVDREERPDVDAIYMDAVQAMTGAGGWPLNAFLTPEQQPFYAGTYFPPEPRHGLPSWRMVLDAVAETWSTRPEDVRRQGSQMTKSLGATDRLEPSHEPIRDAVLSEMLESLRGSYDRRNGGWGAAPKFPQASVIEFLLVRNAGFGPIWLGPAPCIYHILPQSARFPPTPELHVPSSAIYEARHPAMSRLRRLGPRSPSGWKKTSGFSRRQEPSNCHSHRSATGRKPHTVVIGDSCR